MSMRIRSINQPKRKTFASASVKKSRKKVNNKMNDQEQQEIKTKLIELGISSLLVPGFSWSLRKLRANDLHPPIDLAASRRFIVGHRFRLAKAARRDYALRLDPVLG